MFLLNFAFENHLSFRDEAELSMVDPRLRTARPQDGTWTDYTSRVAAIYGANASGKTSVLEALRFMRACISSSATEWSKRKRLPRAAFALDESSKDRPSSFVLDFVIDEVRHQYGFAITAKRVEEEWLYTFPTGRRRVLFERNSDVGSLDIGRELGPGGALLKKAVSHTELVLSKGALLEQPTLKLVRDAIVDNIDVAKFGDSDRHNRLRSVIEDVADGSLDLDDLRTMLRVADVGIAGAEVKEEEIDPKFKKIFREIMTQFSDDDDDDAKEPAADLDDDELEQMLLQLSRNLTFSHLGASGKTYSLASNVQSSGTLTWLSLAAPAIHTLRTGGLLAIDELDASLHPHLAQVMIQMFRDERINTSGAQLIFTTHDTFFMSPTSDVALTPDEVWFVEKGRDGASELFKLSDFPTRTNQNLSQRYLQGRYGAVPAVTPSMLARLAQRDDASRSKPGREPA